MNNDYSKVIPCKMTLQFLQITILVLLIPLSAVFAQRRVTGTVTGSDNAPVPGVTIQVKGQTIGTATDASGKYALTIPGNDAVLIFSAIGFTSQEIPVGDRNNINVTLAETVGNLSEVVVVGYGTQKRREVTSAVTTVKAEEFNKGNVSNVSQLLQGKVAGLSIASPGGDPNRGFSIRLRGLSTLGANTQPLVVIDGQIGADLNTVDPNDIASIDVLKDGSAAAIYGTRGSQGVIIITTKSGKPGTTRISYSTQGSAESIYRDTPHMTAAEFRALGKGTDYGANTDWYKEISRTALSHNHNVSLSGGTESTTYNASLTYRQQEGIAIHTGYRQLNGRMNVTQRALKDRLVLNLSLTTSRRDADTGYAEAFKYATIYNPTAPVYSTDPQFDLTGGGFYEANFIDYVNPVAVLKQNTRTGETKRINFAGSAQYEIIDGLKFLVRYAQQTTSIYATAYLPKEAFFDRNFLNVSGFQRNGYAYKGDFEEFNQLYENTLSYDREIQSFNLSLLGGYSYQQFKNQGESAAGGNFLTNFVSDDLSAALDFRDGRGTITSYKNASKLVAFFGRVNLNYNDMAFLSASVRREGSTQFGENNKWGTFPAVSAGLDLNKVFSIPQVDNLKVRASYGITGSLPIRPYLSLDILNLSGDPYYTGNGNYLSTSNPLRNPNPNLKWESKNELDIGLDFTLFNNRVTGTFDYYNRTTKDLIFLTNVPVPPNQATQTYLNVGELKSNGVELALTYEVLRDGDFTWTTGANFSSYNVKLNELNVDADYVGATNLGTPGQENTQITRAVAGEDIGILWGPVYMGVDADGKYQFDDGEGKPTHSTDYKTKIGNGLPDFEFGFTNTFRYKRFDLNFFLRGAIGHDLINTYRAFYENPNVATSYNIVKTKYFNPNVTDGQIFSSLFVEKASFAKLDNATLGYNFKLPPNGLVKSLRAYLSGQNLFVITGYTGADPEVRYADPNDDRSLNPLAPGVDRRETWILSRTFTLGLNVEF
ncbi:SusC/RagA family TonB-linked outer membrane protein [Chitinophaga japonensis]|uniref:Iron complex outermembrane receptor protein n=1 Tax=Chitinophaga japonensis TaxID=104662 RepID=A0A562T6U5_CHIJA|nr:TonB-dependent receptor [Chitinophaga japonensis]TWI88710.1 iron complex outermembrane receptor protein [Chitinophaga japonensis]